MPQGLSPPRALPARSRRPAPQPASTTPSPRPHRTPSPPGALAWPRPGRARPGQQHPGRRKAQVPESETTVGRRNTDLIDKVHFGPHVNSHAHHGSDSGVHTCGRNQGQESVTRRGRVWLGHPTRWDQA